jgi:predicted Zn-dependent peptidase
MLPWYSSELVQRVAINGIAESVMTFNTNYKDTGLFGVYAVAKVSVASFSSRKH